MNIRTLCLGILSCSEATGYEINKLATDGEFSHFLEASFGSIYPALNKLTDEGCVTWREEQEPGRPSRKIYAITEQGQAEFARALHELPRPDRFRSEFLFFCVFFPLIAPDHRAQILEHHVGALHENIAHLRAILEKCAEPPVQFAVGYGIALEEAALKFMADHRGLLDATPFCPNPQSSRLDAPVSAETQAAE